MSPTIDKFLNLFRTPTLEQIRQAAFGGGATTSGTHVIPLMPAERAIQKYLAALPTLSPEEQQNEGVFLTDLATRTKARMCERMSQAGLGVAYQRFETANAGLAALGLPQIALH